MEDKFETLGYESSDGRKRRVTYDVGSRLVRHSEIVPGEILPPRVNPALDGLTISQAKGLGLEFLLR
jgi:hypothetical protein